MRYAISLVFAALILGLSGSHAVAQRPFDGWASAFVAADWKSGSGRPIAAFDNARRDLAVGFAAAGFDRAAMVDLNLDPDRETPVSAEGALLAIRSRTSEATQGCLLYFTSHGSPDGMVFGPDAILTPAAMAETVTGLCGDRPTVVVVSACFSGIFVDTLSAPNRMVMTAARRDRSSFGCGADITYPYFDGCVIQALPEARDFIGLADAARACVARRETEEGLSPSSEPQVSIGADMRVLLPTLGFNRPVETP